MFRGYFDNFRLTNRFFGLVEYSGLEPLASAVRWQRSTR